MFNNCKHIRSRPNYTRVAALDSAADIYYDGIRLIVGSAFDGLSTTVYANYISTVDSNYNIYKHTCGGTYSRAQQLVTIVNGTIFTLSYVNNAGVLAHGIHKWNTSYNWVSEYNGGATYGNGILKSDTHLFAITGNGKVYSFDTTTTPLKTYNSPGPTTITNARGLSCYNNSRVYMQYYASYYRPAYYTISGDTISATTAITITETGTENLFGGVVCNNKTLYVTNSGKAVVIDCATNTYTYLGTVIPSVIYRRGFSTVGNYIYLDAYYGGTQFHRFNTLDNTFETLNKLTSSNLYFFCAGFGGSTFASERDDVTHQYYLVKIDM